MYEMIYLDNNSTTRPYDAVINCVNETMKNHWQNPSSNYKISHECKIKIEETRENLSRVLGGEKNDFIFTASGTESNAMIFHSFAKSSNPVAHVITTNVEHESITNSLINLQREEKLEATFVPVEEDSGMVDPEKIMSAIKVGKTKLISVMAVNNVTGIRMPLKTICKRISQYNECNKSNQIFIHTDACQAISKMHFNLNTFPVDYATIGGHKFFAPRIGAIYIRNRTQLTSPPVYPLLWGGGQEFGMRSGTENTAYIAGMGQAIILMSRNLKEDLCHTLRLKNLLEYELEQIFQNYPIRDAEGCGQVEVKFLGKNVMNAKTFWEEENINDCRVANTSTAVFVGPPWVNSYHVLSYCPTICASRGSACQQLQFTKSGRSVDEENQIVRDWPAGSVVLGKHGLEPLLTSFAIRMSLSKENTEEEMRQVAVLIHSGVKKAVIKDAYQQ
uniref:Selenocysteine lyase n=1 Tax=Lepeophtheirus salmonis TaxID=72036 RepID=D3PJW2_LEPSM|nr:Selenocysteine lyase [Lepeophtheirus salmonis]